MDIKHLHYFMEVARCQSFSKAADKLFVTQPTISKMIQNLEGELNLALFDRSNKQITLTDAGHVIFNQASVITQAMNDLDTQLEHLRGLQRGKIRIGLPPMIGSMYFPNIIGQFHEKYPDITIQLFEDGSKRIEEEIDLGHLDLGVVVLPVNESVFESFSFDKEPIKLIVPTTHRFSKLKKVKLEVLKDESFILFNEEFALHNRIISSCRNAGFEPNIISKSSQWDFIGKMVAYELGIAFMPESICHDLNSQVTVLDIIHPTIHWELAIIWRKNRYLSYAAKEWLRFTQDQVHELRKKNNLS